jgi:cytochrome b involved in lipid metabolism
LGRYTLEELKQHKTEADAWTAIGGKVYNLTPYLKFHPGGVKDLMRCAGRDGTKLFSKLCFSSPFFFFFFF